MSAGSALVRAVFGDSDDSDSDGADDRASSRGAPRGRVRAVGPPRGTRAWATLPTSFIAHDWRAGPGAHPRARPRARRAHPAAQAWLSRAIRADDLMDLRPWTDPRRFPFVHLATDADTAPSPRADLAEGSPSRRRNQAMRFGISCRGRASSPRASARSPRPPRRRVFPPRCSPAAIVSSTRSSATRTFPAKV